MVADPQGGNPKTRPLVVVTGNAELSTSDELVAVAITGEFDLPLQNDEVLLPWHPTGNCRTKLRKPSVAKSSWLRELHKSDVLEIRGHCPNSELKQILEQIDNLPS